MAFAHGKAASFDFDTEDLSAFTDNIEWNRNRETGETTTFGKDDKTFIGGLRDTTFTATGKFDNASDGPRDVLVDALTSDAAKAFVIQQEGAGTGKPQEAGNALITSYVESIPVGDVITWSADFQVTGPVTSTNQGGG